MSPADKRPPRRRSTPSGPSPARGSSARRAAVTRSDLEALLEQLDAMPGPANAEARRLRRRLAAALAASEEGEPAADEPPEEAVPAGFLHRDGDDDWDDDDHDDVGGSNDVQADDDDWYEEDWDPWASRRGRWASPAKPIAVDGGLTARSRRGTIGETWWSQRFLAAIEALLEGGRSTRGRSYARRGQVIDLTVAGGVIEAHVQGTRTTPYGVRLTMAEVPDEDWERIVDALAARAGYAAHLLAGELPHEIEDVFAAEGTSLFPSPTARLTTECTCPDWANPCKHVAAVCYLVAEAFDRDPFAVLTWRGRTRQELLAALRIRRQGDTDHAERQSRDTPPGAAPSTPGPSAEGAAGQLPAPEVAAAPLESSLDDFWRASEALASVPVHPRATEVPGAVLRYVPRGLLEVGGHDVSELLQPCYEDLAPAAARRALGGDPAPRRTR